VKNGPDGIGWLSAIGLRLNFSEIFAYFLSFEKVRARLA